MRKEKRGTARAGCGQSNRVTQPRTAHRGYRGHSMAKWTAAAGSWTLAGQPAKQSQGTSV